METSTENGEFPGEMGSFPEKWEISREMRNYVLICLFVFAKKITDIYQWYFTEDYNLLKFYDITMILTEDYNLDLQYLFHFFIFSEFQYLQ